MYRFLARTAIILALLLLVGCSGNGGPTTPTPDTQNPSNQQNDLTGGTAQRVDTGDQAEQVLGNFYYVSENQETLAWGTVVLTREGWDYRLDYVHPKLLALQRSDVTRNAQSVIDLSWLKMISVGVAYTNKPPVVPPDMATYDPGEFMQYQVNIKNNVPFSLPHQTVVATQVDMYNSPLGSDAKDIWTNVEVPKSGQTLYGDWTVDPGLADGIYYTRVRVGFQALGGWITIVIFDAKAGAYKVQKEIGPTYYDPVAKGVTTTPSVTVGQLAHVQDNGSFDPDGGAIVSYQWDINNDGTFEYTGPSADFSYDSPGTYKVNLKVIDNEGATDDLTDDPGDQLIEITVTPPPIPPVAVGTASDNEVFVGESISFDGTGSYDPDGGSIVLYEWDWDGNGVFDQVGDKLDHVYDTPGTYNVQLKVTDEELQTDTLDQPIVIKVNAALVPPVACFEWAPEAIIPCQTVNFDASCSTDTDGTIALYEWDFDGDGVVDFSDSTPAATHSYAMGTYDVGLTVTDDSGLKNSVSNSVTVGNALPTAVGKADNVTPTVGTEVHFDGSDSYDNDCDGASIVKYEWDFDSDGMWDVEGALASYTFTTTGAAFVQLQVTDDEGGTDTLDAQIEITINPELQPPVAMAGADPLIANLCQSISFYDDGSYDPDGGLITKYEWDWDNNGTFVDEGANTSHSWSAPGTYQIQFRVTDNEGATDTLDTPIEVVVNDDAPVASATADKTNINEGESVHFDATGSSDPNSDCGDSVASYQWDIDNDGTADVFTAEFDHVFDAVGIYEIHLQVTDTFGLTDTLDVPIVITVSMNLLDPLAYADASPKTVPVCYSINFFDNGSYDPDGGAITKYEWDWDNNGNFSDEGAETTHIWETPGNYLVQFRVTDDEGATGMLDAPIAVTVENVLPTAEGSANSINVYTNEQVDFDGSLSHDNDCSGQAIVAWEWDWEGLGTFEGSGQYASHTYTEPGMYPVQLRVTDNEGGQDDLDIPILITVSLQLFEPIALANADPIEAPVCYSINFFDAGSYDPDGGDIQAFEWDWNNDGTYDQEGADLHHSFATPGSYTINFRVTDDDGQIGTLADPLVVNIFNNLPTAWATADNYVVNVGDIVNFDGTLSHDNDCGNQAIVYYEWDWNNDNFFEDNGPAISHSFGAAGEYQVQLRVTDDEGGMDTLDIPLIINVQQLLSPPVAMADADPKTAIACQSIHFFDDGSYDPDGGLIATYEWDWDNNGTFDETGSEAYHSWPTPGTYYVGFGVIDNEGVTDILDDPIQIVVNNALPTAVATASKYNVQTGELINFDGSASYDNDCGGTIVSWRWDWTSDGTYENGGALATHSYSDPGVYEVRLLVTDNEGSTDILDTPIEITVSLPPCPTGGYTFFGNRGVSTGYSTMAYSVLPRADIAYIENGPLAGQAVVQGGPNSLLTFNPNVDDNNPINDNVFSIRTGSDASKILVTSLDATPFNGYVAEVTSDNPVQVKFIDPTIVIGNSVKGTYVFWGKVMGIDFNSNSDMYAVTYYSSVVSLRRLSYDPLKPGFYTEVWSEDITSEVGSEVDVFDVAVNYTNNKVYVFDAGFEGHGRVTEFDAITGALVGTLNNVFSSSINYVSSFNFGVSAFADIDIDHMAGDNCHILVYGRSTGASMFAKIDGDLNMISTWENAGVGEPSMAINPGSVKADRDLIFPGESKLTFYNPQSNW